MLEEIKNNYKPFAALTFYVFWLISFPMSGFLTQQVLNYSPLIFFLISHIIGLFIAAFFLNEMKIQKLSPYLCIFSGILTLLFPIFQNQQKIIMTLLGITSIFPLIKSILLFNNTTNKILISAFAVTLGNLMVFIISSIKINEFLGFLLISIAVSMIGLINFKPDVNPNEKPHLPRTHLLLIFIFYLTGGMMFDWFLPQYSKIAFLKDFEILFYIAGIISGIYFVKRDLDISLSISILLGGLSFFLYKIPLPLFANLGMYTSQVSFGLADLFLLNFIFIFINNLFNISIILITMLMGILCGKIISVFLSDKIFLLIESGNLILITSAVILFLSNKIASKKIKDKKEEQPSIIDNSIPNHSLIHFDNSLDKKLSEQEKKVIDLVMKNKSYSEISEELNISISTVKTYMKRIYEKTNTKSKDELLRKIKGE